MMAEQNQAMVFKNSYMKKLRSFKFTHHGMDKFSIDNEFDTGKMDFIMVCILHTFE